MIKKYIRIYLDFDAYAFQVIFFVDLVFEVRSDEQTRMMLDDGVPLSRLRVYRTHSPDKVYGEAGNNYLGQRGVKLSKYFK